MVIDLTFKEQGCVCQKIAQKFRIGAAQHSRLGIHREPQNTFVLLDSSQELFELIEDGIGFRRFFSGRLFWTGRKRYPISSSLLLMVTLVGSCSA